MKIKSNIFILLFVIILFINLANNALAVDIHLSCPKEIYAGDILTVSITIQKKQNKDIPIYSLLLNGISVKKINPLYGYGVMNKVINHQTIRFTVFFLINKEKRLFFEEKGLYKITLNIAGENIEKDINVLPVPKKEKQAFEAYKELTPTLMTFLSGMNYDRKAFCVAKNFVDNFPDSVYSKLPMLYFTSMGRYYAKEYAIKKMHLKPGSKVDDNLLKELQLEVFKRNLQLLAKIKCEDNFYKNYLSLSIAENKVGAIIANGEKPENKIINKIMNNMNKVIKRSTYKPHIIKASSIINLLKTSKSIENISRH